MNMGKVLALTDNEDLNLVICSRLGEVIGRNNTYAWVSGAGGNPLESENAHIVWSNLPKPSMLSIEIQQYETRLFQLPGTTSPPTDSFVLGAVGENRIEIYPTNPEMPPGESATQIVVVRSSNHLKRSLSSGQGVDATGNNLVSALNDAFEVLLAQHPHLPKDQLITEISAREREFPTVLGYGIAVPHVYTRHIKNRICCIIRCPDGVMFGNGDAEEPVFLMFLVISPSGDPEGHLAIMAEIAHLINEGEMRSLLLNSENAAEIFRLIGEEA